MTVGSWLRGFLYSQLFVTPPKVNHDFSGQTVIVTGSNVGLGREAARQFATLGCAKLILAVRTMTKGEAAKAFILQQTQRKEDFIEVWPLDMTSTESVQAFARRCEGLERVDVLVANAGIALTYWAAYEGMEQNVKVNVISTCMLALLILPKMRETAAKFKVTPHLEIVSSDGHRVTDYPQGYEQDIFAALADKARFAEKGQNMDRYPVTKLMEIMFVRELVKHTGSVPVVTTVNPGLTHSELANRSPSKFEYWGGQVFKFLFARKTEIGARVLVAGTCVGPAGHGYYIEDGIVKEPDYSSIRPDMRDVVQRKTYEQILEYLEKLVPGISGSI
jgi:retinol dehydrogenase 12